MQAQLNVQRKTDLLARTRRETTEKKASLMRRPRIGEDIIRLLLLVCGGFSIITTLGILLVLFGESRLLFSNPDFSLAEFLTTTTWQPQAGQFVSAN